MSARPLHLGIDLGTTNSTACVFDGEQVSLVRNAQGTTLTPSVVRIDSRGAVTVGARARRFLESDPRNTRAEFKRLMGTREKIEFAAAKLTRRPEELAAEVLRSLRTDVQEQFGILPERAVVSVPALFELPQSAATSEAARLAGFERIELIQEPVASAIAAGWTADDGGGSWLVYDLGGGTFDVSLLETRDGLLRVVGHDGDNFLGGRDFDWAIVDWLLAELERTGQARISRANPEHAPAVRKLKLAVEEAKIELTRAREAAISLPGFTELPGGPIDIDAGLDRATLDRLAQPLVDRSVEVCRRLLAAHGLDGASGGQLARVVLVGGPTVMPIVRERVQAALGAPFGQALDPMTLVAQGAALYAMTAGLDARPKDPAESAGCRVWMQYPAMTSDLTPHVVGRIVDKAPAAGPGLRVVGDEPSPAPRPAKIQLSRADDLWQSPKVSIDDEGAFVLTVELVARRPNVFRVLAEGADGAPLPVSPATITIVQGLTIADPPLSRTIGIALADDRVRVYFERGAPLPARRTFVHHTVETVARGSKECMLKIPIVQGELEHAHLCRLVGALEIQGTEVTATVPVGSTVELTLDLDRGGHLSARALVPAIGQVFEHVAHLLVPDADHEVMEASAKAMQERLVGLRADAFRRGAGKTIERLSQVEGSLAEVGRDIAAARGGDADAGQKARRTLLELDVMLEEAELDKRWPELEEKARRELATAFRWVTKYGTPTEQDLLKEVAQAVERARAARQPVELQRQLRVVDDLSDAAFYRDPHVWEMLFESAASRADDASDLVRAQTLVRDGRRALDRRDMTALRPIVEDLWRILPADVKKRRLGYDSGVR